MIKKMNKFISDERGDTSTVFNLVLAITIIAAVLVILLFVLQNAQLGGSKLTDAMNQTAGQVTGNLTNFTKSA